VNGRPAVILLDRIGELASLYPLSSAAFVGRSLVAAGGGGQSPLEAARAAVPIAVGPNMANFQLVADVFDRADAWQRVQDADGLARAWGTWLAQPELARQVGQRAAKLVESHRGLAIAGTVDCLVSLRPRVSSHVPGIKGGAIC
jgi:3-deoxy-D-manno-octulosonic-acid transferase